MVGASGQASLRDDIERLIRREGNVIQGCVVHLHGKGRGGAAGFALCGVVRLDDVPGAAVRIAVLVGVGVDELGAGRIELRSHARRHDLADDVQVNVETHVRLGICEGSLALRDTGEQDRDSVELFSVFLGRGIQIDRIRDLCGHSIGFVFCHVFYSFQVVDLCFMQSLPS